MPLTRRDVENIASLARIGINDEQIPEIAADLSRILDFVEQLSQAPVDMVDPMAHPLDMSQRLREDAVTETDRREANQAGAPSTADGLYLVPRVID